jgi:hypothetical protein
MKDLKSCEKEAFVQEYFGLSDFDENQKIETDMGQLTNLLYMFLDKTLKEKVLVNAEFLFELRDKNHWVWSVPDILPEQTRVGERLIWLDKEGNVFERGIDFAAAEETITYPCRVYRPVSVEVYRKKLRGIVD